MTMPGSFDKFISFKMSAHVHRLYSLNLFIVSNFYLVNFFSINSPFYFCFVVFCLCILLLVIGSVGLNVPSGKPFRIPRLCTINHKLTPSVLLYIFKIHISPLNLPKISNFSMALVQVVPNPYLGPCMVALIDTAT